MKHPILGEVEALDITDPAAVSNTIARCRPAHIVHLAGIASPTAASAVSQLAWRVHVQGTLNIAHSILQQAPDCVLHFIGSGQIYGASAETGLPLNEQTLLAPLDEYSATKAAADLAIGALVTRGLRCIRLRPFNHTGPGQTSAFVIPSFAMQIARIEARLAPPVIRVGNLDIERDFLDVRDVVTAYVQVVQKAAEMKPGSILNVASGVAHHLRDILGILIELSGMKLTVEQDPTRLRPSDLPKLVGDARLARKLLGWIPEHNLESTLLAVLTYWRERVSSLQMSDRAAKFL